MLKVSIIIPAYNAEKYIEECIDSAIEQTMKESEYEILIVNNGSTDRTKEIAENYIIKKRNIRVISQENRGICGSINTGLRNSKGKYIHILHADDIMDNNLIEECYKKIEDNKLDFLYFGYRIMYDDKSEDKIIYHLKDREDVISNKISADKIFKGKEIFKIEHWLGSEFTFMFNRKFLLTNDLFFDEDLLIEDMEFMPRLFLKAERVMKYDKILYTYRIRMNSAGMIVEKNMKMVESVIKSIHKLFYLIDVIKDESLIDSYKKYFFLELNQLLHYSMKFDKLDKIKILIDAINKLIPQYYEIFGCKITNIDSRGFKEIEQQILSENKGLSKANLFKGLNDRTKSILLKSNENLEEEKKKLLSRIPLSSSNKTIGIYGSGMHTKALMQEYVKEFGEIRAKIIFIDSFKGYNNEFILERKVINICDINKYDFDSIVISSATYEEKLYENLKNTLKSNIDIYRFYEENKGLIFDLI